jgi:hypothetical protein
MDLDMTTEFIGSGESFVTVRKAAGVWFLSSVSPDMAHFVFKTIEGFVAKFTLVRSLALGRDYSRG